MLYCSDIPSTLLFKWDKTKRADLTLKHLHLLLKQKFTNKVQSIEINEQDDCVIVNLRYCSKQTTLINKFRHLPVTFIRFNNVEKEELKELQELFNLLPEAMVTPALGSSGLAMIEDEEDEDDQPKKRKSIDDEDAGPSNKKFRKL